MSEFKECLSMLINACSLVKTPRESVKAISPKSPVTGGKSYMRDKNLSFLPRR